MVGEPGHGNTKPLPLTICRDPPIGSVNSFSLSRTFDSRYWHRGSNDLV